MDGLAVPCSSLPRHVMYIVKMFNTRAEDQPECGRWAHTVTRALLYPH